MKKVQITQAQDLAMIGGRYVQLKVGAVHKVPDKVAELWIGKGIATYAED